MRITNKGGDQRTALFTFRLYRGKTVLGEVECSSNQMQANESPAMDCFSFDDVPTDFDMIKVSDQW